MIQSSLSRGQENVRKQRYLTVSTRCKSIEEAEGWFDTFEHTALPIFTQWDRRWFHLMLSKGSKVFGIIFCG